MRTKGPKSHLRTRKAKRVKSLFDEKIPISPADTPRIKKLLPYGIK